MNNKMTILKKGFTLVELMIVIAIIALLSSIVLASLGASREKANVARFQQQLHSVVIALDLFRQASGTYPPKTGADLNSVISDDLTPYLKDTVLSPSSLSNYDPGGNLVYSINPTTDATPVALSCGDTSATEQYVVYFATSDTGLSTQDYPILYQDGSPSATLRCAFVPNK